MSSSKYLLLKCDSCGKSWISTTPAEIYAPSAARGGVAHHQKNTIECPHCGQPHATDSLSIIATADNKPTLRAHRSKWLAEQAGCEDVYQRCDDYETQRKRAEGYLSEATGGFDTADDVLGSVGVDEYGVSSALADSTLGTVAADEYEVSDNAVASALGSVGADEYEIPHTVGQNPVSAGVERGDKTGLEITPFDNTGSMEIRDPTSAPPTCEIDIEEISTVSQLHNSLFAIGSEASQAVVEAADDIYDRVGREKIPFLNVLAQIADANSDPAAGGLFDRLLLETVDGRNKDACAGLYRLMSQLGGNTYPDLRTGLTDVYAGPLAVLRASSVTPEIVVTLEGDVFEKEIGVRDRLVEYLTELARGCDLTIVASARTQARMWLDYEDELPPSVSENAKPRCSSGTATDPEQQAQSLTTEGGIEIHSTKARILRIIAEGRTDSAYYGVNSDLSSDPRLDISRSQISRVVTELDEIGCVNKHDDKGSYVTLTQTGKAVIDELDCRAGRQTDISDSDEWGTEQAVSPTLKSKADTCNHEQGREGGGAGASQQPPQTASNTSSSSPALSSASCSTCDPPQGSLDATRNYSDGVSEVDYLTQYEHAALFASAPDGGFVLDNVPLSSVNRSDQFDEFTLTAAEDNRNPKFSYREDRDEVVVGAQFHTPLQLSVSMVRALLGKPAVEQVLTADRLDGDGDLEALLDGMKDVLRRKSCLGWLKNEYTGEGYRSRLITERDKLLDKCKTKREMDKQRQRGEPEYDHGAYTTLCAEIMKLSHGLIGTATAIYDYLGIDLHRTIRIPGEGYHNLDDGEPGVAATSASKAGLCKWLVRAGTISSKIGAYRQSRIQFEDRKQLREAVGEAPDLARSEAIGSHIGSWSIVGHAVENLSSDIETAFENPDRYGYEYQTDEPNYADWLVNIPITTEFDRATAHRVVSRMLDHRQLSDTRIAVSLLHAFTESPHDVAYGLYYGLSSEDGREIRVDEVRRALGQLPAQRILPTSDNASTKSKAVHALLSASEPLTQSELCDRAGISAASFAGWGELDSHRDELEAFGLIRETDAGWVVALPYHRGSTDNMADADELNIGLPWYAITDSWHQQPDAGHREASVQGVLYEAILTLEAGDLSNTEHPVYGVLYGSLTEDSLSRLLTARPDWEPLVEFVIRMREGRLQSIGNSNDDCTTVTMRGETATADLGRLPPQTPLSEFA
mgnify:FL=1